MEGSVEHGTSNKECRTNEEGSLKLHKFSLNEATLSAQQEHSEQHADGSEKKDAQTQIYESDSSNGCYVLDHHHYHGRNRFRDQSRFQTVPPRRKCCRKYVSRSKSPRRDLRYHTRIQPAIGTNIDIYGILENVAKTEGAFVSPEDALKAIIAAFSQDAWLVSLTNVPYFHLIDFISGQPKLKQCWPSQGWLPIIPVFCSGNFIQ